jgi:molecular chaperone DnaJ
MEIDFLDAVRGFQANLSIQRPISCSVCGGIGAKTEGATTPCAACRGNGRVVRTESVRVNIPSGAETGKRIRVPGKGADGRRGGPPGDLYIMPRVRSHPLFIRSGRDLTMDLPISIGEAVRGALIKVPTPMGAVEVKVPAGAQSGQLLRIKGKGVQAHGNSEAGDLYLRLLVRVPKGVTEDEVIEKLERAYSENIRQDMTL